jgi:hypothetical protein
MFTVQHWRCTALQMNIAVVDNGANLVGFLRYLDWGEFQRKKVHGKVDPSMDFN